MQLHAGTYLSLSAPLVWDNIPQFAVITGKNGSGKTQLLNLLQRAAHAPFTDPPRDDVNVSLEGLRLTGPHDAAYLPSDWSMPEARPVTIQQIEQESQNLATQLQGNPQQPPHLNELRQELGVSSTDRRDAHMLAQALPARAFLWQYRYPGAAIHRLGLVFRNHYLDETDFIRNEKLTEEQVAQRLGPRPWDVVNDLLAASSLPYRVTTPIGLKIRDPYTCELIAQDTGAVLSPHKLSSGERVLFGLIVALFVSARFDLHSKLLLLDEPDAHLHTAQVSAFLTMVRSKLVQEYGCRVIMTTHRPDTIVQTSTEELFEMSRTGQERIRPAKNRAAVLGALTSHIIDILPATRCVYVEDEDDVLFYEHVRDSLVANNQLNETPVLVFKPASIGRGTNKIAGGREVVRKSVDKLRSAGLSMVHGIEDQDDQPHRLKLDGVHRLARYSFENYLYDPLLVYVALLDLRCPPTIPGIASLTPGEERRLQAMSEPALQSIINAILTLFEPHVAHLPPADHQTSVDTLISGQQVRLPRWVLAMRGHDLRGLAINKIHAGLTIRTLMHGMLRSRVVYASLHEILSDIQSAGAT